jgi:hypothetical protein
MRVTEVTVSSGRTLPHPRRAFGNIKTSVILKALAEDGESIAPSQIRDLQAQAETALIAQNKSIMESINQEEPERVIEYDEEFG